MYGQPVCPKAKTITKKDLSENPKVLGEAFVRFKAGWKVVNGDDASPANPHHIPRAMASLACSIIYIAKRIVVGTLVAARDSHCP